MAMIGEHGPEAVIPLDRTGQLPPQEVHVHLYGNVYPHDIEDLIVRAMDTARRRGRTL
jgi:hypothetical protein